MICNICKFTSKTIHNSVKKRKQIKRSKINDQVAKRLYPNRMNIIFDKKQWETKATIRQTIAKLAKNKQMNHAVVDSKSKTKRERQY